MELVYKTGRRAVRDSPTTYWHDYFVLEREVVIGRNVKLSFSKVRNYNSGGSIFEYFVCLSTPTTFGEYEDGNLGWFADSYEECMEALLDDVELVPCLNQLGINYNVNAFYVDGELATIKEVQND